MENGYLRSSARDSGLAASSRSFFSRFSFLFSVLLKIFLPGSCHFGLEGINTTGRVDKLHRACIKWVAVVADFHVNLRHGCAGCECISTGTSYLCVVIPCRMNFSFHTGSIIPSFLPFGKNDADGYYDRTYYVNGSQLLMKPEQGYRCGD